MENQSGRREEGRWLVGFAVLYRGGEKEGRESMRGPSGRDSRDRWVDFSGERGRTGTYRQSPSTGMKRGGEKKKK